MGSLRASVSVWFREPFDAWTVRACLDCVHEERIHIACVHIPVSVLTCCMCAHTCVCPYMLQNIYCASSVNTIRYTISICSSERSDLLAFMHTIHTRIPTYTKSSVLKVWDSRIQCLTQLCLRGLHSGLQLRRGLAAQAARCGLGADFRQTGWAHACGGVLSTSKHWTNMMFHRNRQALSQTCIYYAHIAYLHKNSHRIFFLPEQTSSNAFFSFWERDRLSTSQTCQVSYLRVWMRERARLLWCPLCPCKHMCQCIAARARACVWVCICLTHLGENSHESELRALLLYHHVSGLRLITRT